MNMVDNDAKSAKPFKQRKSFGEPLCCEKRSKTYLHMAALLLLRTKARS